MKNASLFIYDISYLVTMDHERNVLRDAWIWIEDGYIKEIGTNAHPESLPGKVSRLSGSGKILIPGLVNTHHHFYQNMARAYTPGNNLPLLPWLKHMNKLWQSFRENDLNLCTRLGLAELMLSGATTIVDHHYVFPKGAENMVDAQFEAASLMGVRFHASRGSMNVKSDLISDWAIQSEDAILEDTERLIYKFHSHEKGSFQQIIIAPCAATSCSESLLRSSAEMARNHRVGLHTHCGETVAENEFSLKHFGSRPLDYLLECGWDYKRAWLAHGIHFNNSELEALSEHEIGIAHCPNANMRLGSGICPVPKMLERMIKVGIAVDGSASNDSGHILGELRQALYLARVDGGAEAMSAIDALELGTWRAAELIGRDDIGRIVTGFCGDCALYPVQDLYSNGCENPVDALLICHPRQVSELIIGGNIHINNGNLSSVDLDELMHLHRNRAKKVQENLC